LGRASNSLWSGEDRNSRIAAVKIRIPAAV
jgi:hypothetical protein